MIKFRFEDRRYEIKNNEQLCSAPMYTNTEGKFMNTYAIDHIFNYYKKVEKYANKSYFSLHPLKVMLALFFSPVTMMIDLVMSIIYRFNAKMLLFSELLIGAAFGIFSYVNSNNISAIRNMSTYYASAATILLFLHGIPHLWKFILVKGSFPVLMDSSSRATLTDYTKWIKSELTEYRKLHEANPDEFIVKNFCLHVFGKDFKNIGVLVNQATSYRARRAFKGGKGLLAGLDKRMAYFVPNLHYKLFFDSSVSDMKSRTDVTVKDKDIFRFNGGYLSRMCMGLNGAMGDYTLNEKNVLDGDALSEISHIISGSESYQADLRFFIENALTRSRYTTLYSYLVSSCDFYKFSTDRTGINREHSRIYKKFLKYVLNDALKDFKQYRLSEITRDYNELVQGHHNDRYYTAAEYYGEMKSFLYMMTKGYGFNTRASEKAPDLKHARERRFKQDIYKHTAPNGKYCTFSREYMKETAAFMNFSRGVKVKADGANPAKSLEERYRDMFEKAFKTANGKVKRTFRSLSKEYHPDNAPKGKEEEYEVAFKILMKVYEGYEQ